MYLRIYTSAVLVLWFSWAIAQEEKEYKIATVAFYNLENLFDTEDDPLTFDDDRTPEGKDNWTLDKYNKKVANMAKVIGDIGKSNSGGPPVLIGLCELENRKVVEDLVNQPELRSFDYGIIQFDSPDRRGIDVALIYQKGVFNPTNYKAVPLYIYEANDPQKRVYTRDQLVVSGKLDGDTMHFIVNHWPSRRGGEAASSYKRENAAKLNKRIIDSLFSDNPYAKIITMGDLNDDPNDKSVKKILGAKAKKKRVRRKQLYNPMANMFKQGMGTLAYRDNWNLFDQIILSDAFLDDDYNSYRYFKAGIYNPPYLINQSGPYKGYPYRSVAGSNFLGGYSDHFAVFVYLIKEIY